MRFSCLIAVFAVGLFVADQASAATELEQRAAISAAVQKSFLAGDFERLESMSSKYRKEKSRTVSGNWNLALFYSGIEDTIENQTKGRDRDVSFGALEEKTEKWLNDYPESPTGHIARAMVLIYHGWAYRGGGYGSTVSNESKGSFRHYIAIAKAGLEKAKSVASIDPKWYDVMFTITRAEGCDRSECAALLDEALDREPLFYQTYYSALQCLLPKWGGGIQEIENFARESVERTKEKEGNGIYARIYWIASLSQFKNDIFNNSLVDWPQMKRGFDDVISRYPDPWNLNNYARFACLARDKPKTIELFKRIETSVVADAWEPLSLKQECAQWASRP